MVSAVRFQQTISMIRTPRSGEAVTATHSLSRYAFAQSRHLRKRWNNFALSSNPEPQKSGERKSAEQRAESKEQRAESKEWSAVVCCQAGQAEILRSPLSALRSSLSAPSSPLFALRSLLLARRAARR